MNQATRELIQLSVKMIEGGDVRNVEALRMVVGVCDAYDFGELADCLRDIEPNEELTTQDSWVIAAMIRVGEIEKERLEQLKERAAENEQR